MALLDRRVEDDRDRYGRHATARTKGWNVLPSNPPPSSVAAAVTPDVHPILVEAFEALDRSGLRWALVRGADDLARPDGDVDLLVEAASAHRLDDALAAVQFWRLPASGRGSHRFYFRYDAESDLWLKLDVVTRIAFGTYQELVTPLAAPCLARVVERGALRRLHPQDEAWLLLLHVLLDKRQIAVGRRDAVVQAARTASADGPFAALVDSRVGASASERLLTDLRFHRFESAEALGSDLLARWARRRPAVSVRKLVGRVGRRLSGTAVAGRRTGGVVAVMGPDGAGKTTLAEGLTTAFPLATRYVYMGLWREGRWDGVVRRLPGARSTRLLWRGGRASFAVGYQRLRGRVVVVDRFAYDALSSGDRSLGGRALSAVVPRLTPAPDIVLLLDAPGSVMFARKGEHSVAVLEERRQAYLRLRGVVPHLAVLDATRPAEDVRRQAVAQVWDRLAGGVSA